MPQVKYENAKGLYQTSGTGFEIVDGHVKPAIDYNRCASLQLTFAAESGTAAAATDSDYAGKYFDISDTDTDYRVWFTQLDDGSDPVGSQPSNTTRTLVNVELPNSNSTAQAVRNLVVSALESAGNFLCGDGAADGTVTIFVTLPAAMQSSFDTATVGTLITEGTIVDGQGDGSFTLDPQKKVHVLRCAGFNASNGTEQVHATGGSTDLPIFVLGDGLYTGQEKIIIRDDIIATATISVDPTNAYIEAHSEILTTQVWVFTAQTASAIPRILHLMWAGAAWVTMNASTAGSGLHATGGVTGGNA